MGQSTQNNLFGIQLQYISSTENENIDARLVINVRVVVISPHIWSLLSIEAGKNNGIYVL